MPFGWLVLKMPVRRERAFFFKIVYVALSHLTPKFTTVPQ